MADDGPQAPPENFIILPFADGEYKFALPVGQIAELQAKCDAGIGLILARVMAGRYRDTRTGDNVLNILEARFRHEDVRETIRLGLIGGNEGLVAGDTIEVPATKALNLVRNYVDGRPLEPSWQIAAAVLSAAVVGYIDPDNTQKKTAAQVSPDRAPVKAGST